MNPLKKLVQQTAIYGTSTIAARLINYFLVPLHVYVFLPEQYGIVGEMYSYVALLIVLLTYGFETAFFRYYNNQQNDKERIYSTSLISILVSSVIFIFFIMLFSGRIATAIRYPDHPEYIRYFALIIIFDVLSTIPFAKLRATNRPKVFAFIKVFSIVVCFLLNVIFLYLLPYLHQHEILHGIVSLIYNPAIGVGYIFIANLISSALALVLLFIMTPRSKFIFDASIWKKMMIYALPLLVFGLAGNINETFDRILLKYLSPANIAMHEVGIYSACYKFSILMTIAIQGFKYAAEPFFFSQAKEKNAKELYAEIMKYFVIICSLIFLAVMLYIDVVKYFVSKDYFSGLKIVPILLLANMFLGVFYNLSIWYKLTDRTIFGAYLSITGAVITLSLNFLLIPVIGYMGSAWATFACYSSMMVLSYIVGQKYYHVNYDIVSIGLYILYAVLLYLLSQWIKFNHEWMQLSFNTMLFFLYFYMIYYFEKPVVQKILHRK